MNGTYTIYKREKDGSRGSVIAEFTSLEITLSWSELSKWTIEGVTTDTVPLAAGDSVIIYRNGVFFLGGIVQQVHCDCTDPAAGVKYWTANGSDDTLMLSWRQVLADPIDLTFDKDTYDQIEDCAYNRLIHYIDDCIGSGTVPSRRISHKLVLPGRDSRGGEGVSAFRMKALDKVLKEIGTEDELYPYLIRSDSNGEYRIRIRASRDKTADLIISPDFGNVTAWSRKELMPEFNAVWVVSGDYSEGRLYVYTEDSESVKKYGRIEQVVTRSDVKPFDETEPIPEDEETPMLTEEDVLSILEQEAETQLKEHGRKRTWTVEAAETREMAFLDDWQIGDRVTCVIDGEKFESRITEAKITYAEGIETVIPTVGDVERGLFGKIFDLIDGLDDRITNKENE